MYKREEGVRGTGDEEDSLKVLPAIYETIDQQMALFGYNVKKSISKTREILCSLWGGENRVTPDCSNMIDRRVGCYAIDTYISVLEKMVIDKHQNDTREIIESNRSIGKTSTNIPLPQSLMRLHRAKRDTLKGELGQHIHLDGIDPSVILRYWIIIFNSAQPLFKELCGTHTRKRSTQKAPVKRPSESQVVQQSAKKRSIQKTSSSKRPLENPIMSSKKKQRLDYSSEEEDDS